MSLDRREFLLQAGLLGVAASAGSVVAASRRPLKILILGGTGFLGPHMVQQAIDRGHEVTLFNRGKTNKHLFPEVEKLVGDRDGGLDALKAGSWDVVLDNSGYVPRHVRDSARLLQGRAGRYLYTSTISVYDWAHPQYPFGPHSNTAPLSEPGSEDVSKHYGALKALCEEEVLAAFGAEATTIVRPTYVCGPGDKTQRYTWWVDRVHRGGEVLAPGDPQTAASIIDVRDLARFCIHLLEQQTPGTFNACGPAGVLSFGGLLESIRAITNVPVTFQWVNAEFLAARVKGREIPLWTAEQDGYHGLVVENQTSIDAGLTFTTLADTARATREWHQSLPQQQQAFTRAGIAPAKEQEILEAWRRS